MKPIYLYLLTAFLSYSGLEPVTGQSRKLINLNEDWIVNEFKAGFNFENSIPNDFQNPGGEWFKATMPAQVQDILFANGLLPDPHTGKNPTKWIWVFEKDWVYVTRFATPGNNGNVFLCFDGIDTRADIWLNGKKIGECANMFRKYRFQVNSLLKNDGSANVLSVFVHSPAKFLKDIDTTKNNLRNYRVPYLGDAARSMSLELFGKKEVDMTFAKMSHQECHIAFTTDDPEKLAERMVYGGAKIIGGVQKSLNGDIIIDLADPSNFPIRLIKRNKAILVK